MTRVRAVADATCAVDVWAIPLEVGSLAEKQLHGRLTPAEVDRASRFQFARDRRRFIVSHAAMRAILGGRAGVPAEQVEIGTDSRGKPAVPGSIAFNLAHSGEIALCAVSNGAEVGVDVEQVREVSDAESILRGHFAPGEVERWLQLPGPLRNEGFLRLWTCKEAWLKACGLGLSLPMNHSEIRVSDGEARFVSVGGRTADATRWTLRMFEPAPGYTAAVCVEAPEVSVRCRQWAASW